MLSKTMNQPMSTKELMSTRAPGYHGRPALSITSKIERVPMGIQGEKSSKVTASWRNLVSTIGAQASP